MAVQKEFYTVHDIEGCEEHIELISGAKFIEDKTSSEHNTVVNEIVFSLKSYIKSNDCPCNVFSENVALYVNELCDDDSQLFLPDVMVVCGEDSFDSKGVHKAPLFVAEVTSETTRKNDYNIKLDLYKKIGVAEYWIVDLQRGVVFKYLASDDYIPQTFMHPESIDVSSFEGLSIDFSDIIS